MASKDKTLKQLDALVQHTFHSMISHQAESQSCAAAEDIRSSIVHTVNTALATALHAYNKSMPFSRMRLPLELWTTIWKSNSMTMNDRIRVACVCKDWRTFSLSTPSIWARIDCTVLAELEYDEYSGRPTNNVITCNIPAVSKILERSGEIPLDVRISICTVDMDVRDGFCATDLIDFVAPLASRIESLEISTNTDCQVPYFLEAIHKFPSLRWLFLRGGNNGTIDILIDELHFVAPQLRALVCKPAFTDHFLNVSVVYIGVEDQQTLWAGGKFGDADSLLTAHAKEQLLRRVHGLEILHIRDFPAAFDTDEFLGILCFPKIRTIRLDYDQYYPETSEPGAGLDIFQHFQTYSLAVETTPNDMGQMCVTATAAATAQDQEKPPQRVLSFATHRYSQVFTPRFWSHIHPASVRVLDIAMPKFEAFVQTEWIISAAIDYTRKEFMRLQKDTLPA
ncbi:hypothetical protein BKA62DRAFT_714418 [Auriculariales sp. MPI-PUGE-AT-0066]|nr:hypothetical protein BKA62DRAFT_714418 [Auriculariales sp. MPI-PUGE-AT-0066]